MEADPQRTPVSSCLEENGREVVIDAESEAKLLAHLRQPAEDRVRHSQPRYRLHGCGSCRFSSSHCGGRIRSELRGIKCVVVVEKKSYSHLPARL